MSIKEIAISLKKVKTKKDLKKLQTYIARLDDQAEGAMEAMNNLELELEEQKQFATERSRTTRLPKKSKKNKSVGRMNTQEYSNYYSHAAPRKVPQFHNKFTEDNSRSSLRSKLTKEDSKENGGSNDNNTVYLEGTDDSNICDRLQRKSKSLKQNKLKRSSSDYLLLHNRTELPCFKPKVPINVFKILKDAIGKDLSKFCVPVYFNEPLSMLQRSCEFMRNEELMSKAAEETDSLMRIVYLGAFCIAQYGGTQHRCTKPFNPILGETYEFKTKKWRYCAEQVSHHPPITAAHVKSKKYELWLNTHLKSKFYGKSVEVSPLGLQKYMFKDTGDVYEYQQPKTSAQNVLIGTMYIDHRGDSFLENTNSGECVKINFHSYGVFTSKSKRGLVTATVYDSDGEPVYEIFGKWTEALYYKNVGEDDSEGILIWQIQDPPEEWAGNYYFSRFGIQLNMIDDHLRAILPPTDSRHRSDQRHLEEGELKIANDEKKRLEEKQRRRLKRIALSGEEYEPRYFVRDDHETDSESTRVSYRYLRNYWKDRKHQNWSGMPDLFGEDSE